MSIFQCFLVVKIMMIYAKILLSRKTPKSLQNVNWKNFHVASDHCIQKIANKIGMDVDIDSQELTSTWRSNKTMLNKIKIQIRGISYEYNL